jgi:hypothetical protein
MQSVDVAGSNGLSVMTRGAAAVFHGATHISISSAGLVAGAVRLPAIHEALLGGKDGH